MNTTKLNKNTKKAKRYIELYKNSDCHSVNDFYGKCSSRKASIEQVIRDRMRGDSSLCGYKVLCGSCFDFTCGYMASDQKTLYIETKESIFEIAL